MPVRLNLQMDCVIINKAYLCILNRKRLRYFVTFRQASCIADFVRNFPLYNVYSKMHCREVFEMGLDLQVLRNKKL